MSIAVKTALLRFARVFVAAGVSALAAYWAQHSSEFNLPLWAVGLIGSALTGLLAAVDKFTREKRRGL